MPSTRFDFANAAGRRLSGVLEGGASPPRAFAIFAHCFTCDKTSLAATRVTRALAAAGIGILRFDFTGLGGSEGDFGGGLSSDVADIVAAATAMAAAGQPVQLLIGHSFGGAAVLAAAASVDTVKAVATIAAPFDAEHVLHQIGPQLGDASPGERVAVAIGGRPFELGREFIDDIRAARQDARIARLGRALLVLHAPGDTIVGIDNAAQIFQTAKHPKSFVSLDRADHLLRDRADADYAAAVIAAWAGHYLDLAPASVSAASHHAPVAGVRVEETGNGKFEVRATTATASFLVDEPPDVGGNGSGPTPFDLLSAGLAACTAMTCRLYATRKGWPLGTVTVDVGHTGKTATEPDRFVRRIAFAGDLDDDQITKLVDIAERCPVHRTLTAGAVVATGRLNGGDGRIPDVPEAHERAMEQSCVDADRA